MSQEIDRWILPEMGQLVNQRHQIFEKQKKANQRAGYLESLAQQVQALGQVPPKDFSNLTTESLPPQQLDQSIGELEKELDRIKATQAEIKGCNEEIKRLRHQRKMILIGLVLLIAIAAVWLVATLK
jgi:chromosome segregation ATPase